MNVISYETAKRLKAAGFPQPTIGDEQFWYNKYGHIVCYGHTTDSWGELYEGAECFAPSAADILRQMPGAHLMWFGVEFRCKYRGESYDRNPSEACAAEWLRIFEPKAEANTDAKK